MTSAEDCPLPEVREGDVLAFLSTGGYGASMASHHCARPPARELFLPVAHGAGAAL